MKVIELQVRKGLLTGITLNPFTHWYDAKLTAKPPPITNASVGSHIPFGISRKSKKPKILL